MLFVCSRGLCQSVKICSKISFFLMPPPWHWRRSHIVLAWQCLIYSTGRFLCWRRGHQMSRLHFPTSFQLPSSYPTLSYLPCWTLCCCISDRCRTVDFPRQWWQSWNQPGRIAHSWASYKKLWCGILDSSFHSRLSSCASGCWCIFYTTFHQDYWIIWWSWPYFIPLSFPLTYYSTEGPVHIICSC